MIIRTPSAALRKRIVAAGEAGPLDMRSVTTRATAVPRMAGYVTTLPRAGVDVLRHDGSELSESEQRRVAGLVAADDAEPFT